MYLKKHKIMQNTHNAVFVAKRINFTSKSYRDKKKGTLGFLSAFVGRQKQIKRVNFYCYGRYR